MLKAISLFCGAGGCSLGFKNTGKYDIIAAFDNNKAAVESYNENFGNDIASILDLANCDFSEVRKKAGLRKRELDIIIGGPPCQGFSSAGTRFWDDPRNSLIRNYTHALEEFEPKWFFMENVEGILTTAHGDYIVESIKKFSELGYSVIVKKVYSQEYGVPQRRKRVIVLGTRMGVKLSFPKTENTISGPIYRNSEETLDKTIGDLIGKEIPGIDHIPPKMTGINLERIRNLSQGQSMKDLPEELQHESFKKRSKRRVKDGTPTEKRGGAPSGLKRLISNEPCLTITSASTREFIHPVENRPLTIRECARIQTFPDTFKFYGSESDKIKQIGNAIPPMLAELFADHIYFSFFSEKTFNPQGLLDFELTKADAMSPALKRTHNKLSKLLVSQEGDLFYGII